MYSLLVNVMSLLADGEGEKKIGTNQIIMYVILGVVVVALVVWFFLSSRKNKQKQKEYVEQLDAIAPGNKVKTAGGICGIVVEVCDDNTVIIKTGSEASGYSFVKMEKELIAQTDAKGASQLAREEAEEKKRLEKEGVKAEDAQPATEEVKSEEKTEEAPAAEKENEANEKKDEN